MPPFRSILLLLTSAVVLEGAESPPPEPAVELDALVVNAAPFGRTADELAESVSVLAGPSLDSRRAPTLGQTLDGAPGVSSTYFGPGASRPLIRGLGGERIRILTNGLGSSDVSGTSPDHAVSFDPALVERIEVLRGPAALLYGSSAVGGLVNVVDHQVPGELPEAPAGLVEASYGTGADEKAGRLHVRAPAANVAWQVSLQRHQSGDIDIPGFAEAGEHEDDEGGDHEEHAPGVLANSAIATTSGSGGVSWFGDGGFVGLSLSTYDSRYGVPGHEHEEGEDEEEGEADGEEDARGGVEIDLQQRRFDVRAERTEPWGGWRSARWRLGVTDYRHLELEGDEIGTRFDTEAWETRLDLVHQPIGPLEGAIGAHVQHSTLTAAGEEAFVPPTRTLNTALFAVGQIPTGIARWQFGSRWENQDVEVRDGSSRGRAMDTLSVSAGGVWSLAEAWSLGFSLARTERAPTAQELFADGPHAATQAYEIGDANLGRERSLGLDVTLRRRAGPVTGALTVFVNDFDAFIMEDPTAAEEDGLPVYQYRAGDARFSGAELEVTWHLHAAGAHALDLTFTADTVRATDRTTGEPLPRIPALRTGLALAYRSERWTLGADVRRVGRQTRVAAFETESDGYTLVGAHAGYQLPVAEGTLEFFVRASNLTNEEARPHTSFLKDIAPLPGRNVTLGARWEF
jgi:iron complex outermembrane receptor protein